VDALICNMQHQSLSSPCSQHHRQWRHGRGGRVLQVPSLKRSRRHRLPPAQVQGLDSILGADALAQLSRMVLPPMLSAAAYHSFTEHLARREVLRAFQLCDTDELQVRVCWGRG
jgi:hypothetical protein